MSLPPPPGYGIALVSLQKAGLPHLAATTLAFANPTGANASTTNTAWRQALTFNNTRLFHATNLITGWSVVETYVLQTSAGGVTTASSNITIVNGTRVAVGMPPNTSVVVTKSVTPVGRQYRGRMLLPPTWVASANIDSDGVIAPASVTSVQGFITQLFNTMVANNLQPVLLHQPPQGGGSPPAPTVINGLSVNARIGTIRHRIRR